MLQPIQIWSKAFNHNITYKNYLLFIIIIIIMDLMRTKINTIIIYYSLKSVYYFRVNPLYFYELRELLLPHIEI